METCTGRSEFLESLFLKMPPPLHPCLAPRSLLIAVQPTELLHSPDPITAHSFGMWWGFNHKAIRPDHTDNRHGSCLSGSKDPNEPPSVSLLLPICDKSRPLALFLVVLEILRRSCLDPFSPYSAIGVRLCHHINCGLRLPYHTTCVPMM